MIEYFVQADGGRAHRHHVRRAGRLSRAARHELPHPAAGRGGRRRSAPARSICRRPARARRRLTRRAVQVHADRPAHAGQDALIDMHYRNLPELAMAIADALAAQVRHLDADVVQVDEANLPGSPDEWEWAAAAMNRVLDAVKTTPAVHLCFGNYGGQIDPEGQLGEADRLSQRAARRSYRDGNGAPAARGARGVPRPAAGDRLRARRRRHQVDRDRDRPTRSRAAIERAEQRARRRAASDTSIRTAASGCSSATSPTARSARWSRAATSLRGGLVSHRLDRGMGSFGTDSLRAERPHEPPARCHAH